MDRRAGAWLAGAGVAFAMQMVCLVALEAILSGAAGYEVIVMPMASVVGVLVDGCVLLIATGLPPPQIAFLGGGISANVLWLLAGFSEWRLAAVAVISVVAVVAFARRIRWRTISA